MTTTEPTHQPTGATVMSTVTPRHNARPRRACPAYGWPLAWWMVVFAGLLAIALTVAS